MSAFFPHVNLPALKKFAAEAVATAHPSQAVVSGSHAHRIPTKPKPRVSSCDDVVWAGEKMILISFDPASLPFGPPSILAYFPRGRPRLTTQAVIGMMATVSSTPLALEVPRIYDYKDYLPNEVGAEVVLMEKLPGEPLEQIWPTLTDAQAVKVIVRLTELLLKLFNHRGPIIATDLVGTGIDTRVPLVNPQSSQLRAPAEGGPVLLARALCEPPLLQLPPQPALTSSEGYLAALAARIERVFTHSSSAELAREGHLGTSRLSDADVARARETWHRFASLIPYHVGGFYIPGTLSLPARQLAYTVLGSRDFGIYHGDMQMSRFLVRFDNAQPQPPAELRGPTGAAIPPAGDMDVHLSLATGWEHAYRAPLWACARFPPWLTPRPLSHEPLTWEVQRSYRLLVLRVLNGPRLVPASWAWIVAHVFGGAERWFEGCLGSHWVFRDALEVLLVRLKAYWMRQRPDVPFPLLVGKEYVPLAIGSRAGSVNGPRQRAAPSSAMNSTSAPAASRPAEAAASNRPGEGPPTKAEI